MKTKSYSYYYYIDNIKYLGRLTANSFEDAEQKLKPGEVLDGEIVEIIPVFEIYLN